MSIDISKFHATFFEESLENLDAMEAGLLSLEGAATQDPETINTIFRAAHSIKGGAGTFGFAELAGVTHLLETLLDQVRNGQRAYESKIADLLLQSVDVLRGMIFTARDGGDYEHAVIDKLLAALQALLAQDQDADPAAAPDAEAPAAGGGWKISFKPCPELFASGNDPLHVLRELDALGELQLETCTDGLPLLEQMQPDQCYLSWTMELRGSCDQAAVREVFAWIEDECELQIAPLEQAPAASATPVAAAADASKVVALKPDAAATAGKSRAADGGSIRVSTGKVDALINLVGELVITQAMLKQCGEGLDPARFEALVGGLDELQRNTRDLQDAVMSIRMMPMEFAFQRFPRLVRDLAPKLGKQVRLETSGEATELDKSVIEKIVDPLNHLVRNSIDHGIESPGEREAAGKEATGVIRLSAEHVGGKILIRIEDDGKGLDRAGIIASAQRRGVDVADDISDADAYQLIFMPGLSTAEAVSDVSGRGVGMDVVKKNIVALGGQIDIESNAGAGTSITISLPLTLAILDGMLVRVSEEVFILPLAAVVESLQAGPDSIKTVSASERLLRVRSDYIPVLSLRESLRVPDTGLGESGVIVVVEHDGQKLALEVDDLIGQQQVVIKNLESNYRRVPGISGATILGDGRVALIVDAGDLQRSQRQAA